MNPSALILLLQKAATLHYNFCGLYFANYISTKDAKNILTN